MESSAVLLWGCAGYFGVTHFPEADMIHYGKPIDLRSHKKLRIVHGHI